MPEAGVLGFLDYTLTAAQSPLLSNGQVIATLGTGANFTELSVGSTQIAITAGVFDLQLDAHAFGEIPEGGGGENADSGFANATLTYSIIVKEDRIHWITPATGLTNNTDNFLEQVIPTATQYLAFNRTLNASPQVTLDASRTMRGLIVDGTSVNLNLAGHTLNLGTSGLSSKTYNIIIGEGLNTSSSLTLRNGTVDAGLSVLVGADAGPDDDTPVPAQLIVDTGGSLIVGGRLSVAPAIYAPSTVTVRNGGTLSAQNMNVADRLNSKGDVTITDPGSSLQITGENLVNVGVAGEGTVHVQNGGSVDWGAGTAVSIGNQTHHYAEVNLDGAGTTSTGGSFFIGNGAVLQVRNHASLTSLASTGRIEVATGGSFVVNNATVNAETLVINGGLASFANGADVTFQDLTLPSHGRLQLLGAGTKLHINGDFTLGTGKLETAAGSDFFAHDLLLAADSLINGVGTLHCDQVSHPDGTISPGFSPGILTIDGNYNQSGSAVLQLEVGGLNVGTDYDQLIVTGNASLNGHILFSFINGFAPLQGQTFTLIDVGGTITGTPSLDVSGLEPGWLFSTSFNPLDGTFALNSLSNGVAVVPEPTQVLALMGFALPRLRRRTRP